jgi:hypothetical protein
MYLLVAKPHVLSKELSEKVLNGNGKGKKLVIMDDERR